MHHTPTPAPTPRSSLAGLRSIHLHYELAVPADALEATERALTAHLSGCPAHESVKGAIDVTWDATVHAGDRRVSLRG